MTLKEATMAGQDNLHIVREIFSAWNAHDVEGLVKRLDTKTTWKSDAFPAPFSGHEGARQFFKLYVTAFPDLHFDVEQILPAGDSHVVGRWRSKGTHHCWHGPSWERRGRSEAAGAAWRIVAPGTAPGLMLGTGRYRRWQSSWSR